MSANIENKTDRQVLLRFNSGKTQHLAPGQTLGNVMSVEIKGNRKLEKLEARRVVEVHRESTLTSGGMTAEEAVGHIEKTPLESLKGFIEDEESRKTVLEAWSKKQRAGETRGQGG